MARQPIRTGRVLSPSPSGRGDDSDIHTGRLIGCRQNIDIGPRVVKTGDMVVVAPPDADLGKDMAGERLVAPIYDGMTGYGMAGMRLVLPPENQDA